MTLTTETPAPENRATDAPAARPPLAAGLTRQALTGLRLMLVLTVVLGVAYPAAVWAVGQVVAHDNANGSLVRSDGATVGSSRIGQANDDPALFHPRPSPGDYDALASAPSNLGPSNPDLLTDIAKRRAQVASTENVDPAAVPPDAVTASGSGLDPDISPAYAAIQAPRVARANGLSTQTVRRLVDQHTHGRSLGFLGDAGVNVLELNLAVREAARHG